MRKVGPGCLLGLQIHVILRQTEGMADMQSRFMTSGWHKLIDII
jgi:hypothetical protein